MGVYKKIPFPFINIANFVVVNPNNVRNNYKRWKEVPFEVKPICPNDLEKMRPVDDDSGDEESVFWSTNTD